MKKKFKLWQIMLIVLLVMLTTIYSFGYFDGKTNIKDKNYTEFLQDVEQKKIKSVTITEKTFGPREVKVVPESGLSYTFIPPNDSGFVEKLVAQNIEVIAKKEPSQSTLTKILLAFGPTLLFVGVWLWFMKGMTAGGKGGIFGFNKSKAQLIDPAKINVGFNDVVGCNEAKQEIQEFVDFLKNPQKFSRLGGKIPHGVLLTGPSGTGKTLLAKALAKESGVPFFSLSGSEFVEMFVGVGASRVRDLFEQARKVAPCVLFIDEIDAIGGKRGMTVGGGDSEREQTLNQILVELDGLGANKGVILVAATNRPEMLDPALLRPGRIDRQIVVNLPDVNGREEILRIHSRNVPLAASVNLKKMARGTPGLSGAELANLINEAAIFAARRNSAFVEQIDLENAKDKVVMGVERPTLAMSEEDKRDTAYHESGHAIVARVVKNADPVHKVTVVPRGRALGVTMQLPEKDHFSHKKEYLEDKIAILMGGKAAEEIFCNTMTTGASNDIMVATGMAKSMVQEWGMTSLGPVAYGDRSRGYLGSSAIDGSSLSEATLREVDLMVRKIIVEQYERAKEILTTHKDKVEAMTQALMEVETIDDRQIDNIMKGVHFDTPSETGEEKAVIDAPVVISGKDVEVFRPEKEFVPDTLNEDKNGSN